MTIVPSGPLNWNPKLRTTAIPRRQISLYNREKIGLCIYDVSGDLVDPDSLPTVDLVIETDLNFEVPETDENLVVERESTGVYSALLPTVAVSQVGLLTATWSWTIGGETGTFVEDLEVLAPLS